VSFSAIVALKKSRTILGTLTAEAARHQILRIIAATLNARDHVINGPRHTPAVTTHPLITGQDRQSYP